MKYRLGCVDKGVKKFVALVPEDQDLKDLDGQIKELLTLADEEDLGTGTFQRKVSDMADTLEAELGIEKPKPKLNRPRAGGARGGRGRSGDE